MIMRTSRILTAGVLSAVAVFAQYKAEPAGAPPSTLPAPLAAVLQSEGTKITGPDGPVCEIWLVKALPKGGPGGEQNVTLPDTPHGSFMGVIRYPGKGKDRRGQLIKPGVYTLRYSIFPIDGAHQGAAPQRDFLILSAVADDTDPAAKPAFDKLMAASKKSIGTEHPGVVSIWKADDENQNLTQQGENDWVLQRKVGDTNIAIVVVGTAAA
jgi:hypothetical protein